MKKFIRSSVMTGLLFVMAVVLLTVGTIGGTQAALQEFSEDWISSFNLENIGVTLLENETPVSWRNYGRELETDFKGEKQNGDLLRTMIATQKEGDPAGSSELKVGRQYDFRLAVSNTGDIDQYVRVTIYRYWVDVYDTVEKNGWFHGDISAKKLDTKYDPSLIDITLGDTTNWIADPGNKADSERLVYYYKGILPHPDEVNKTVISPNLTSYLTIKPGIMDIVEKNTTTQADGTIVTTYTYFYDNIGFVVRAEVDAVQTHHARDAMASAWGLTDTTILNAMKVPVE